MTFRELHLWQGRMLYDGGQIPSFGSGWVLKNVGRVNLIKPLYNLDTCPKTFVARNNTDLLLLG